MPLSDDELQAIWARYNATTPGPWESWIEGRDFTSGSSVITTGGVDLYLLGASEADQDFIASAKQDVPRLLDEIERLKNLTRL